MQSVPAMTLGKSLKSLFLNLWDEKQQKLVSFKSLNVTSAANKQN